MRRAWVLAGLVAVSGVATAQSRLVTRHAAGLGAAVDVVRFGGGGVEQFGFAGRDSVRVRGATQLTLPVAVASSLGAGWRLDVTALHAIGRVTFDDARTGVAGDVTLRGTSDVRVRATGRFLVDGLVATVGVNAPTGRTNLGDGEYSALRVLVAPALALGSTPVGTGPSGILGLVASRLAGPWTVALGGSFEHRGRYQPVAALTAGTEAADFRPGSVMRTSMAAERLVGVHRLNLGLAADVFRADRLRGGTDGAGAGAAPLATVQLGPVLTADAQLQLGASRWREVVLYSSALWRARYARDGITVGGSSGRYVEGGVRAARPVRPGTDVVFGAAARVHSGLATDVGLATRAVRAGEMTVGLRSGLGPVVVQPYLRGQAGVLGTRAGVLPSRAFRGFTSGLVLQGRF
ncbi:MAG: hypothetical protein JNJ98_02275 [Gemmatimonadetes bacterium]|nr:hypothetical protein [Gemmatimonadota bacterium]